MKAEHISIASKLEDLPNIGPTVASLLRDVGIHDPLDLCGQDAIWLYNKICQITRRTHNYQLLDRILSAIDFAEGGRPRELAYFSNYRKNELDN